MSTQQEGAWIETWSDLYDKLDRQPELALLTADWLEISKEDLLSWIQDEAYRGYRVGYEKIWFKGGQALRYFRSTRIE